MRTNTLLRHSRQRAWEYLGREAELLSIDSERRLIGTLEDGRHVAVWVGRPPDEQFSYFQVFWASAKASKVSAGEPLYAGSQTAVRHPSRDALYGGEPGRSGRGPWSIDFLEIGRIIIPSEFSSDSPQLITTTSGAETDALTIIRQKINLLPPPELQRELQSLQ